LATRRRLDAELVRRGLVASRRDAVEAVSLGRVLVNGAIADKATRLVAPNEPIVVLGAPPRFVSRGGEKLAGAISHFDVELRGRRVLDAGASTGGFTDCALQAGAAHVIALDVGHAQLHERIRSDERVTVIERYNVRNLVVADIGGLVDAVVADLSFISLTVVLPALMAACRPGADAVLLVKPQFEAGRAEVARGRGVVTDPAVHDAVRARIDAALVAVGATVLDWTTSPLLGADGNKEFFVHARASSVSADG
jgi:23S rRNA (cytidine1920-2'-O)/16S rRNA (cytidine1409-2'-O)-methyltransferase